MKYLMKFCMLMNVNEWSKSFNWTTNYIARATTPSCRRCGAEMEPSVPIPCVNVPQGKKKKDADLGLCQDQSGSNKIGEAEQYCGPWQGGLTAK